MSTKDFWTSKQLLEQATSVDRLGERILQEQLRANDQTMRRIAESLKVVESQTYQKVMEQMATINWPKMSELVIPKISNQVAEMLAGLAASESFNAARLSAVNAIASTLEFHKRNQALEASIAASFAKMSGAQSVTSLTAAFAKQIVDLEQFHSQFAQTMSQMLRARFDEFEQRNQKSFERLEQSTDEKLHTLETKVGEPNWVRMLQRLVILITLATFVLDIARDLESKEQSKTQMAYAVQMLAALQQIANKAEQRVDSYYLVRRPISLKEKPDNRSKTLATLERDDEVRLIERKHKWILVEYDSESGLIYGWVNKKYLKRTR